MLIKTYDDKGKATYDLKALGEYLQECKEHKRHIKDMEKGEIEACFMGYLEGVDAVINILEAGNYRVESEEK